MSIYALVGYISSKKAIYQFDNTKKTIADATTHYTHLDHFDAHAVFSYLQIAYFRRYSEESVDFSEATAMILAHSESITNNFREYQRQTSGLLTIFHILCYGRKLCVPDLQKIIDTEP